MTSEENTFEKSREVLWGTPGFQVRRSTIISPSWLLLRMASWIVETVKTDDGGAIFLQWIGEDGGQRIVIPDRVAKAIYRHYESIMKHRRKERAKRGAITRKQGVRE